MSGINGDLLPKQEAALKQFKTNLKDVMQANWDDYFLLRWLRARSFDIKKSEKMLRDNIVWRKREEADKFLEWEVPEVIRLYYPGGYMGEDKEGYPILMAGLGYMDVKGMLYSTTKRDLMRFNACKIERMFKERFPEQSKKFGKRIDKYSVIFDMSHFGMKHLWKPGVDMFTSISAVFEANYPDVMKKIYVINAPKIFPVLWNIIKPFLHEETRKKIKVLGKNYKKQLLEDIDAEQVPKHWGGSRTDPDGDEFCKSQICMGGKIPEKYRMKNIRENIDMSNFENCTVQRGSSVQLEYDVKDSGSTMRWQFISEGNDIGFGVYRRTSSERQKKDEMDEIFKTERVNSHMVPEEGSALIENPGTYVVRFDNTYSWVKAKPVSYLIEVLAPDQENELQITEF